MIQSREVEVRASSIAQVNECKREILLAARKVEGLRGGGESE